jgi:putative transcriptional regulator
MAEAHIPTLVKELRGRLQLTQEQFAQKVGVTYSTVNHWENGKRSPQPYLVRRLLQIKEDLDQQKKRGR